MSMKAFFFLICALKESKGRNLNMSMLKKNKLMFYRIDIKFYVTTNSILASKIYLLCIKDHKNYSMQQSKDVVSNLY